jgi:N-acyl-D-aspartate/D-glutamate deacylase
VHDLVIRNAFIVDGTGSPGVYGDVAVSGGRVTDVVHLEGRARRVVDADGQVLAPGFVDLHTHYDAQAFWDTTLSPSPAHGVTTVIGGNCGFSIAPLSSRDADYLMRMLARVEGMPLESLQAGVPWDWATTGEFLDRLDGRLTPNAGFMVGHSALRLAVMHEAALTHEATPAQVAAMRELLAEGLWAGALGLSSTWSPSHNDHNGNPVPSRFATAEEILELCDVVGTCPGTTLEFLPGIDRYSAELFGLMTRMSRTANRPVNWNVLKVDAYNGDYVAHQLAGADDAAANGGRIVALSLPDSLRIRVNFKSGFVLDLLPGWGEVMGLPDADKLTLLSDPQARARLATQAAQAEGLRARIADWSGYRLLETFTPDYRTFEGSRFDEIARALGTSVWDALVDIVVADQLKTVIGRETTDEGPAEETWKRRAEVWQDPRVVVGASDAGAHLDMADSFSYCVTMLARGVRDWALLSMEEAVRLLTDVPARFYGLTGRGRIQPGWAADLVIFDPASIEPGAVRTKFDLPGGAGRLTATPTGIDRVFVNGVEAVFRGQYTDARPGRLLRSGIDTSTVTVR